MSADADWDTLGYITSSHYRETVLTQLATGPQTPSDIAAATDHKITHISRSLGELRDRGIVELLVSESRRKGRIYGLTEDGEQVASMYRSQMGGDGGAE